MNVQPQTAGAITTQNLVPTGVATTGSAVTMRPGTAAMMLVTVTGTYTGALSLQVTGDGSTWLTITETCFAPVNGGASTATIASGATGQWRVPLTGYVGVRITGLAAMTGTANVSLNPGNGGGVSTDATPGTDQDVNLVGINGVAPSASNPLPVTQAIPQADYSLACSANLADATFPNLAPTTTTPAASSTRAVFAVPSGHDNVVVTPFGVGANNATFSMRLTGWQQSSSGLWIPTLSWTLTSCTLDTALPGITSEIPDNTNFFCDALTLSAGIGVLNSNTTADSLIKNIAMDDIGSFDFLEITVDMTGATSANALYLTY